MGVRHAQTLVTGDSVGVIRGCNPRKVNKIRFFMFSGPRMDRNHSSCSRPRSTTCRNDGTCSTTNILLSQQRIPLKLNSQKKKKTRFFFKLSPGNVFICCDRIFVVPANSSFKERIVFHCPKLKKLRGRGTRQVSARTSRARCR